MEQAILNEANRIIDDNSYDMNYDIGKKYFRELRKLYKFNKEEFMHAYNDAEGAAKLSLAIVIFNNSSEGCEEIEGLEEYINDALKAYVFEFFKCDYENEIEIKNYLNGNDESLKAAAQKLKALVDITEGNILDYKKINSVVYHLTEKNELAKRLLKLLAYYFPSITGENIFAFSSELDEAWLPKKFHKHIENFVMKLKELELPKSFYLVWAVEQFVNGFSHSSAIKYFEKVLDTAFKKELASFKEAIDLSDGISKQYLQNYLIRSKPQEKAVEESEIECVEAGKKILLEYEFTEEEIDDFVLYMEDTKDLNHVLIPDNIKERYCEWGCNRENFKRILWFWDIPKVFKKVIRYFIYLQNTAIFNEFIYVFTTEEIGNFNKFIGIIEELNVEIKEMLPLVLNCNNEELSNKLLQKWVEENPYEIAENIQSCREMSRSYLIELIYESGFQNKDRERFKALLEEFITDSSSIVKETVREISVEALNEQERKELAIPYLKAKNQKDRIAAVNILVSVKDEECTALFKAQLEIDKSEAVKKILRAYLHIKEEDEKGEIKDINEYCKRNLNNRKKAKLNWLVPDTLPSLVIKESGEEASVEIVYYMLILFADNKEVKINLEVKDMMSYFTEESLNNLAYEVLTRWYEAGAEAKKKWILSLVGMMGDIRSVKFLEENIKKWAKNSRAAIACEALKALAINGSNEALMLIDNIARSFKIKRIKKEALEALEFAAKELEIDKEELNDRIVSKLGFDKNGDRIFDYGTRKFIVKITPELQLSIIKEDGKQLKNLPSVGKNDDEHLAKKAREEFKILKKQLKTLVEVQSSRLDRALSVNRKWTAQKWSEFFIGNVVMQRFAVGLIWGVYEEDKLINSFRYMEDGTLNTVDEEEFEIPQQGEIGLVHPIELCEEYLQGWKQQLEDYEIIQPVEQLNREVFLLEEEDSNKEVHIFSGIKIQQDILFSKLIQKGWYKSTDVGAFWEREIYKHYKDNGFAVELMISSTREYDTVIIYGLRFHKVEGRDTFTYYSAKEENLILPKEVPVRLFSEILNEVNSALLQNLGFDKKWRKKRGKDTGITVRP